ncbi:hypothetical protein LZC95_27405 [Pendulispora brunnea]|uniref:Uncharacterized protein n=1 Tax=Pendulispora brunnea TaxID=2905690 RepID=A0ABZ2JUW5_9BACT
MSARKEVERLLGRRLRPISSKWLALGGWTVSFAAFALGILDGGAHGMAHAGAFFFSWIGANVLVQWLVRWRDVGLVRDARSGLAVEDNAKVERAAIDLATARAGDYVVAMALRVLGQLAARRADFDLAAACFLATFELERRRYRAKTRGSAAVIAALDGAFFVAAKGRLDEASALVDRVAIECDAWDHIEQLTIDRAYLAARRGHARKALEVLEEERTLLANSTDAFSNAFVQALRATCLEAVDDDLRARYSPSYPIVVSAAVRAYVVAALPEGEKYLTVAAHG